MAHALETASSKKPFKAWFWFPDPPDWKTKVSLDDVLHTFSPSTSGEARHDVTALVL